MALMADVTVKKNDGTTDVVYTAIVASAGDSSEARWSSNTSSTIRANRDVIAMSSTFNGPRTARRVTVKGSYPIRVTVNGAETVEHNVPMNFTVTLPVALTDAQAAEAVSQFINFLDAPLISGSIASGYAPV